MHKFYGNFISCKVERLHSFRAHGYTAQWSLGGGCWVRVSAIVTSLLAFSSLPSFADRPGQRDPLVVRTLGSFPMTQPAPDR